MTCRKRRPATGTAWTRKHSRWSTEVSYEDPYDKWKEAKDFACEIPLVFYSSPHELAVYQINSDRSAVPMQQG